MNLFRSEEHVRKWTGFQPGAEEGIVELATLVRLFSGSLFTRRLDPDYFSHYRKYIGDFFATLGEIGKARPFWLPR